MIVFSVLPILLILPCIESKLNILAIFPYQAKTHFQAYEHLLKELTEKGHQVTVISYFPQENPTPNYHDISLAGKAGYVEDWNYVSGPSYLKLIGYTISLMKTGTDNCRVLLSDENVQNLWHTGKKFDVALVEQFNSDCALAIAFKLKVPVVGITSNTLMPYHYSRFGVPNNPSYTAFQLLNGGTKPNILQRIERTVFMIYFKHIVRVVSQSIDQYTISKHFHRMPPLEELGKHTKLMLINEHFILFAPTTLPTNVKQVGGFHITETKPLSTELEKFINGSKKGVIYISFGAIVTNNSISSEKLDAILKAVSKLRQKVIWKWEENSLPGNPEDIFTSKWLPQNDILAHPNVIAMFSHCGLLGLSEAIYHGKPVICMPMFGDQPRNAAAVEESGLGVQIQVNELNNETLFDKFTTVLETKFRKKVKLLSKMWRDRPKTAKEEAIYWIEYAARYPNATFRTAFVDVPVYQTFCLDVIVFFAVIFGSTAYFIKYMYKVYKSKYDDTKKLRKFKWKRP